MERRDPLILASGSPRRQRLLQEAGLDFEVIPADIDESVRAGETPHEHAGRLAHAKALAVARRLGPDPPCWVLGADTIVVLGESVLGKPADPVEAVAMLRRLAGRTHRVITAVALVRSSDLRSRSCRVESAVEMRPADDAELERYVASGEPLDKAGGYALQGEGRRLVAAVRGSETNVIGLPLEETLALLDGSAGA